jgi:hypothetical protein
MRCWPGCRSQPPVRLSPNRPAMADFLMGMGFGRDAVEAALAAVGEDNVEMAAALLLQQGSPDVEHADAAIAAADDGAQPGRGRQGAAAEAADGGCEGGPPLLPDEELAAVVELGFGALAASKALILSHGDGQRAARWLLEQQGEATEREQPGSGGRNRWLCSPPELTRALCDSSGGGGVGGLQAVRLQLVALCEARMDVLRAYEGSHRLSEALLGFLRGHAAAEVATCEILAATAAVDGDNDHRGGGGGGDDLVGAEEEEEEEEAEEEEGEGGWRGAGAWAVRALSVVGTRAQLLSVPTVQTLLGCVATGGGGGGGGPGPSSSSSAAAAPRVGGAGLWAAGSLNDVVTGAPALPSRPTPRRSHSYP